MPTPKQMEKLAVEAARRQSPHCGSGSSPCGPILGIGTQRPPGPGFGSGVFRRCSATYCAFPAAAASGPWKSRLPMQSDCMAVTRSGRSSRSGCSTTPASSALAGVTGVRDAVTPLMSLRLDVRMARNIPYAPVGRRSQGSGDRARQGTRDGQHPGRPIGGYASQGSVRSRRVAGRLPVRNVCPAASQPSPPCGHITGGVRYP
jgi:hypothetical protein